MPNTKSNVYLPTLHKMIENDPFCHIDRGRKIVNGASKESRGPVGTDQNSGARSMYWSPTSRPAWCPSRSDQQYQANPFLAERDLLLILRKQSSFAKIVLDGQGVVNLSIREWQGNDDHHWTDIGSGLSVGSTGHGYLTFNSLGFFPNHTAASILKVIGRNINTLFPYGGNTGGDKKSLKLGDTFALPPFGSNHVQIVYVCDWFFVLQTTKHILVGIAIHGIFQDSKNEFWMFQEGWGEPMDPKIGLLDEFRDAPLKLWFNYTMAERMWIQFAKNTKKLLNDSAK